jgi:hypothetical protein
MLQQRVKLLSHQFNTNLSQPWVYDLLRVAPHPNKKFVIGARGNKAACSSIMLLLYALRSLECFT